MTRIIEQDTPETLARVALLETKLAGAADELRDARAALSASTERERRMREALEALNPPKDGAALRLVGGQQRLALAPVPETPPRVTPDVLNDVREVRFRRPGCDRLIHPSPSAKCPACPDAATPEAPKAAPPTACVRCGLRMVAMCPPCREGLDYPEPPTEPKAEAAPRAPEPTPEEDDEPSREPTCSTCNDTHWMSLTAFGRQVPCSQCPSPCEKCGNLTGFCRETPCSCDCHPRAAPTPETAGEARPTCGLTSATGMFRCDRPAGHEGVGGSPGAHADHDDVFHVLGTAPAPDPVSPLVGKGSGGSRCVAHWVPTPKPEDGK